MLIGEGREQIQVGARGVRPALGRSDDYWFRQLLVGKWESWLRQPAHRPYSVERAAQRVTFHRAGHGHRVGGEKRLLYARRKSEIRESRRALGDATVVR